MTPPKVPNDEQIRETLGEVGDALQRALVLSTERIQSVFEDAVVRGRMTRRDAEELASNLVAAGKDQAAELIDDFDEIVTSLPPVLADAVDAVDPRGKKRRADAGSGAAQAEAEKLATPVATPKPAAKKAAPKKPAAKKAAPKKPAAKKAASTSSAAASATKSAAAKKPAAKKAPAKKPAAAAKPKPAPAPTTATKTHIAEPAKQGAGPTPSPVSVTAPVRELLAAIPTLTKTELSELRTQEAAGKNRKTVLAAIDKKLG